MTHPLFTVIVVVGAIAAAAHCRPAPEKSTEITPSAQDITRTPADTGKLGGTSWRLVKFEGSDETTLKPDDPEKYTIGFEPGGRLRARIDCNRGTGTWKSSAPPQLELGPLALTRAMCPPGSLHDQIVKRWPYVRSYVMKDGHLFLSLMADGGIFEFEPISSGGRAAIQSLENTYWKLTRLGGAPVVSRSSRQREPHLILNSATESVSGSGGCNGFSGSYRLNGQRLSLGPDTMTLMACTEGMETEQAFLKALEQVNGWRITGQQLDLLDKSGQVVAHFEAVHL